MTTPQDFDERICEAVHTDLNRRITSVETLLEKVSNRIPLWATFLITGLSSTSVGLMVFVSTAGGR